MKEQYDDIKMQKIAFYYEDIVTASNYTDLEEDEIPFADGE